MKLSISHMRRSVAAVIAVAGLMTLVPADSRASVVFYTDRTAFNTAEPGLPVQNFSGANLFNQPYVTHSSPLNSATNDAVFAAGSILPGLTVTTLLPGMVSNALIVEGGSVGPNWFGDTLILSFAPGVSAVGTDIFANTSPGSSLAGNFTEDVYNGSTLLGSKNFSEAAGAKGFIGVSSTIPITSVNLLYTTDDATTFVDNIAFGSVSATPEPSTYALAAIAGIWIAARRRRT
jgi:hypothetical protein